MTTGAFNRDKFAELLLYVAEEMAGDPTFGATKLNKVLFYADQVHYAETGKPITGATYRRLPYGPAPKELLPVRTELIQRGEAALRVNRRLGTPQKRLIAMRKPDISMFSATELEIIDEVIESLHGESATVVSQISHQHLGWRLADENEEIPYFTTFLSSTPMTNADIVRGQEVARQYGLLDDAVA